MRDGGGGSVAAALVWALALTAILYTGVSGGGYDHLVWGQVGLALWWLLLLGAGIGIVAVTGVGRPGALALLILVALAAWTALATAWGESAERGAEELARVLTYIAAFVAALAAVRAGHRRALVGGVTVALAAIGVTALLSHLHPSWFPADEAVPFLSERDRLDYPLGYYNTLAALLALGITLLLGSAAGAYALATRGLAAAGVPALALALYFTLSRGGIAVTLVAALVFLVLSPRPMLLLGTIATTGAGVAVLVAAAEGGVEGDGLLLLTVLVCALVGLFQVALSRVADNLRRRAGPGISPREIAMACAGGLLLLLAFASLGGASEASELWNEFRETDISQERAGDSARLVSVSARGRYQLWESALDAAASAPLEGIGAGSFEFWWAREGDIEMFVRDAHSLYLETLAELGVVGLLLVVCFVGLVLASGGMRAFKMYEDRALMATAAVGCFAFSLSAAIEWVWEVPVIPLAFLGVAAAAVARPAPARRSGPTLGARMALAGGAVAALLAIGLPLAATSAVRESEESVAAGRLGHGLEEARTAERLQPYAATPTLQRSLIEERLGRLQQAAHSAAEATESEPTNWRPWVVLSRVEARRGRAPAARRAYLKARSLNPRSRLFAE